MEGRLMTLAAVPLKPPAPYYGGKTRLAPWIVSLMSPHQRYIEPFAGTASVLLAKAPSRFEVINDLDGDVVTFFRVLRDRPDELERACRLTPYAREEFLACRDCRLDDVDDLERARRWWVRVAQGFNNDALIYCDPPYLGSTRTARSRREHKEANAYTHEMLRDEEHIELADVLRAARGHVLLSGYDSPLYEELYDGWWRAESSVVRVAANHQADTAKRRATEVVWSNRPLNDGGLF